MLIAVIPALSIDGVKVSCEDVCRFFLEVSDSEVEDFLRYIFRNKSQEVFLFYVQGFIYKILWKYLKINDVEVDDVYDLVGDCIECVIDKMRDYEEGKGKLISYIYTIVRGVVTKYVYRKRQEGRRFEYSDVLFYRNRDNEVSEVSRCDGAIDKDEVEEFMVRVKLWERVKKKLFWS